MEKMEKIEYMIVHVGEHTKKKDLVSVYLEPTEPEKLNTDLDEPRHIEMIGQNVPPEIGQIIQVIEKMSKSGSSTDVDERNIVILKPKLDFLQLGWKYGDIIEVSFKKIKEAENVKPRGEIL